MSNVACKDEGSGGGAMSVIGTGMTGAGIDTAGNTGVGVICSRGAMGGGGGGGGGGDEGGGGGGGGGDLGGGEAGAGGGAGGDEADGPGTSCGLGAGTSTGARSPRLLRSLKSSLVQANQSSNSSTRCSHTSNRILRSLTSLSIASWLARRVFNRTSVVSMLSLAPTMSAVRFPTCCCSFTTALSSSKTITKLTDKEIQGHISLMYSFPYPNDERWAGGHLLLHHWTPRLSGF